MARQLDNLGYRVIAGFLDVTSQSALDLTKTTNNVSALQLDVTSEDQVDVATQRVTSELHGIGNKEFSLNSRYTHRNRGWGALFSILTPYSIWS